MSMPAFDTLKVTDDLREAGFEERQARQLVKSFAEEISNTVVTQQDLKLTESRLDAKIDKLDAKIDGVAKDLRSEIKDLDVKIDKLDVKIDNVAKGFDAKLELQSKDMLLQFKRMQWLSVSGIITFFTIISLLLKFF